MPLLAKEVIHAARDAHPGFDRKAIPDAVAVRALARYQQAVLARLADLKGDAMHQEVTISLPLATFSDGAWIAEDAEAVEFIRLHGAVAVPTNTDNRRQDIVLVTYEERLERYRGPAAYLRGERLFLLGQASDWTDFSSIVVDLFPRGSDTLDYTAGELVLPKEAQPTCVAHLAAQMAIRVPEAPLGVLRQDAEVAHEAYLDLASRRRVARVGRAKEVW